MRTSPSATPPQLLCNKYPRVVSSLLYIYIYMYIYAHTHTHTHKCVHKGVQSAYEYTHKRGRACKFWIHAPPTPATLAQARVHRLFFRNKTGTSQRNAEKVGVFSACKKVYHKNLFPWFSAGNPGVRQKAGPRGKPQKYQKINYPKIGG